jgi:hypothetical protein
MRKWIKLSGFAAIAVVALVFFSCGGETPVTIEQRISDFVTSLNGDRTDTYKNLDTSIAAYQAAATPTYWDTLFGTADKPYAVDTSALDKSDVTKIPVTITGANGFSKAYQFYMVNSGTLAEVWVIHDILLYNSGTSAWVSIFGP